MSISKRIISIFLLAFFALSLCSCDGRRKYTSNSFEYFDTVTTVTGYAKTQAEFNSVCEKVYSLLEEYHKLYNIYYTYEGLNNLKTVNQTQGPVKVDEKILALMEFCKETHTLTGGYINVAMGSVLSIWHEYREEGSLHPEKASLPSMAELENAAKHMNIENIAIDRENGTIERLDPEMLIDVGAIAKGYAAQKAAEYLRESGIMGYILNVGGNVCVIGAKADGSPWKVGIENPTGDENEPYIEYLCLTDGTLVTSGSYQRFYYVDGVRYHHIIDKDTLMPENEFLSVSVRCPSSALGDALSTALFCMSLEEGKALVSTLENVSVLWVKQNGEKIYSDGWKSGK